MQITLSKFTVICEGFSGAKQQTGVAELPQQSRYCGVVIDDKDDFSIWYG
jgi:hypothetical protein